MKAVAEKWPLATANRPTEDSVKCRLEKLLSANLSLNVKALAVSHKTLLLEMYFLVRKRWVLWTIISSGPRFTMD